MLVCYADSMVTMNTEKIGFIGAGNMAYALISGLLKSHYSNSRLIIFDINKQRCAELANTFNIQVAASNLALLEQADIIVLAVKPQTIRTVIAEFSDCMPNKRYLFISIAAGITIDAIQSALKTNYPIIRCMPNTPAQISCGATGLFANQLCNSQDKQKADFILSAVGVNVWVDDENQLDAVTALSGSGPAYFFLVLEALQEAGIELGLNSETSRKLALHTAYGATKMALESENSVEVLRSAVTSPGGTTEKAITVLEQGKLKELFKQALSAAENRAKQLAKEFHQTK